AHPATDVGADVEGEVTRADELAVEAHQPAATARHAAVHGEGPRDPPGAVEHALDLTGHASPPLRTGARLPAGPALRGRPAPARRRRRPAAFRPRGSRRTTAARAARTPPGGCPP